MCPEPGQSSEAAPEPREGPLPGPFRKVSILVPVYNERFFAEQLLQEVLSAPLPGGLEREVIVVDDASTDGTREVLEAFAAAHPGTITLLRQERNRGKGAALRRAVEESSGEIILTQDADLEYDPGDYGRLLAPILSGEADAVYGSRFQTGGYRRVLYFWHTVGNRLLTTLSNMFTGLNLTDMETGYKAVRALILKSIPLRSDRFGIEPEITAKLARRDCRIFEVPISYRGRSYDEGKKITWRDGLRAVLTILKYRLIDDAYDERYGHAMLLGLSSTHRFNRWIADTIRPWVGSEVLELGSGLGNITLKLLPRDRYVVSDTDPLHLDYLRNRFGDYERVEIRKVDLELGEDFDALEGRFDTAVCLNVLEHVRDDETALRNIHRALAPGGRALVLVPAHRWLHGTLDEALDHHRRYSREELRERFQQAGLRIDRLFSFNRVGTLPWFLNARILRRRRLGRFQLKVFDSLVWFWRFLSPLLPLPGLSLVVVASRPGEGAD